MDSLENKQQDLVPLSGETQGFHCNASTVFGKKVEKNWKHIYLNGLWKNVTTIINQGGQLK